MAMKRYFILMILTFCFVMNSTAQEKVQKRIAPKEDVKVNREYDEKGNLIKFDSVYTYSLSGDTTLLKSFSPPDFPDQFGSVNDSTFLGNSFFDDFDPSFFSPFSQKRDSLLIKEFGLNHNFSLKNDSLALNFKDFDDFFNNFGNHQVDSILSKSPHHSQFKSMDEMMKILQHQMQEMEKQHREFFKEQPKWREF
jgi:hypothetical protein